MTPDKINTAIADQHKCTCGGEIGPREDCFVQRSVAGYWYDQCGPMTLKDCEIWLDGFATSKHRIVRRTDTVVKECKQ
jgi:hypothetical protein